MQLTKGMGGESFVNPRPLLLDARPLLRGDHFREDFSCFCVFFFPTRRLGIELRVESDDKKVAKMVRDSVSPIARMIVYLPVETKRLSIRLRTPPPPRLKHSRHSRKLLQFFFFEHESSSTRKTKHACVNGIRRRRRPTQIRQQPQHEGEGLPGQREVLRPDGLEFTGALHLGAQDQPA